MTKHYKVAIIGSGPAGFTSGIYTSRANYSTAIFEGMQPGGQLMITTDVENFPGFPEGIAGPEMMEVFRKQAHKFGAVSIYETIIKVDFTQKPFVLWSDNEEYTADAVIIATGATARRLRIPTEGDFWGRGISACATCDGFFYRDAKIFVVGGGDTAMEEAMYLTHFGESVTIVHRREGFRASKIMLERAQNHPKIKFITNAVIEEFLGTIKHGQKSLTHIKLKDTRTGEISIHEAGGVFYGIGHEPNTKLFEGMLDMDEHNYLVTAPDSTKTKIPGIFAAGDVQDPVYRQAISAAGSGCMAAIEVDRYLQEL
jgi:thioredoxin reductase (NADPH)